MFKETCMSQYCEYSVVCMSHATCIENDSKSLHVVCMLHAHNMQTCMANVPNPRMLHAKNMPVTCRDLGRISTRVLDIWDFLEHTYICTYVCMYVHIHTVEPFTPDTIGTTVSVLISGVSLFQGLILYTFVCICGKTKCPDLRVSE